MPPVIRYIKDDPMEIVRRLPPHDAAIYAVGVLHVLSLRPDLRWKYTTRDLAYLQSLANTTH